MLRSSEHSKKTKTQRSRVSGPFLARFGSRLGVKVRVRVTSITGYEDSRLPVLLLFVFVCVLHIKPFFLPVDTQHTPCPCLLFFLERCKLCM